MFRINRANLQYKCKKSSKNQNTSTQYIHKMHCKSRDKKKKKNGIAMCINKILKPI